MTDGARSSVASDRLAPRCAQQPAFRPILCAAVAVVLLLALLKPDAPHWLPLGHAHVLRVVELR